MPPRTALIPTRNRFAKGELDALRWAHEQLEEPSFAARLSNTIGTPIEAALKVLPQTWNRRIRLAAETSIRRGLAIAVPSLGGKDSPSTHNIAHKVAVSATGAVAGFVGPLALLAELPVTTLIMLRSIAEIARSEGEDLASLEGRTACVEVFALGGRSRKDDAADAGYYGLRLALALHFFGGVARVTGEATIPLGMTAVRAIAARFGVVVSDKVALQMVPVVGALTGAAVNLAFMQHFQDVARGHFMVRRLERKHGSEAVRAAYMRITREKAAAAVREFSPLEGW